MHLFTLEEKEIKLDPFFRHQCKNMALWHPMLQSNLFLKGHFHCKSNIVEIQIYQQIYTQMRKQKVPEAQVKLYRLTGRGTDEKSEAVQPKS